MLELYNRSRMPPATVGSPICSGQRVTGNCDVRISERDSYRSSQISQKSRRSVSDNDAMGQSSITRASIRHSRAGRLRKLPSARASARSRNRRLGAYLNEWELWRRFDFGNSHLLLAPGLDCFPPTFVTWRTGSSAPGEVGLIMLAESCHAASAFRRPTAKPSI
jgi:hypothetical protein